jgi:uncharacterized protein (DUF433 family)
MNIDQDKVLKTLEQHLFNSRLEKDFPHLNLEEIQLLCSILDIIKRWIKS